MSKMNRRQFLKNSSRMAGSTVIGLSSLQLALVACGRQDGDSVRKNLVAGLGDGGYGPLFPAGADLLLPDGFQYRLIGVEGTPMSDGNPTPGDHDGTAAFALPNGNIRLVRNHEETTPATPDGAFGDLSLAYDTTAPGGTTSLEIDPATREIVKDFVSLSGTYANCAGGPTPWGTWLSCEETCRGRSSGYLKDHGYAFQVSAMAEEQGIAKPLKAMGRFFHEAAAVDPETGIVYETEDAGAASVGCGFYRFIPDQPYIRGAGGDLAAGGRLQMLAVKGHPNHDMAVGQLVGRSVEVEWVDIADPDPAGAESNNLAVAEQGWEQGAASFKRLEGCWWGDGHVFLTSTNGGEVGQGQVWRYTPNPDGGLLTLLFESPHPDVMDHPDNICVSPRGGLVICEDGVDGNYIRGLTSDGFLFDLAFNAYNNREFTGTTFSPDGETLFFNIQSGSGGNLGKTFAVWGPWERGVL